MNNVATATLIALAVAAAAAAHPAVDVVVDSRGTVFYSDLHQVWMVSVDGKRSVAVAEVHTHELYLDGDDTLYGEHLWYEGDATGRWGYRVWRRTRDGVVSEVIPPTTGFRTSYSFDRDRAGNHYFACNAAGGIDSPRSEVRRRAPDGAVTVLARGFGDVSWIHAAPDGTLLLLDRPAIKRIAPGGAVTTLVADADRRLLPSLSGDRHDLMGVWPGLAGEVYVARHRTGEVLRIATGGAISTALACPLGWAPSGGMVTPDGAMWVLEWSALNAVRVRRIAPDGSERVLP